MDYYESDRSGQYGYEVMAADQSADAPQPTSVAAQEAMDAKLRAGDPAEDLARGRWFQARAAELVQALVD